MIVNLSELPVGSCFRQGKAIKKKIEGEKTATVAMNGRVKTRKVRGNPQVEPVPCTLRLFGVGLRRHPDQVVEIGHGNLLKKRDESR